MKKYLVISIILLGFWQCQEVSVFQANYYDQPAAFSDSSATHPQAATYQAILDNFQGQGFVGATLLVKDQQGLWVGAAGYADIASQAPMGPHSVYFIASISKLFTSAAVYRMVDKGLLELDSPISPYLSAEIVDKVANVEQATIAHLLAHRSGIPDFYTTQFDLDRLNTDPNWRKQDVIEYVYGKKASFDVDQGYEYSNTNFLLLSMILEQVSGNTFEEVYQQQVFEPLALSSAYYSEATIIPPGVVKGYVDLHDNEAFVESRFLYEDELGIGGDGGVAINAYDLAVFLQNLVNPAFISEASQAQMTNWFSIEGFDDVFGQTENGYGLERFNTPYASAIGHTGGIDGFTTFGCYFPETDMTYVLLCNSADASKGPVYETIFEEVLQVMFAQ